MVQSVSADMDDVDVLRQFEGMTVSRLCSILPQPLVMTGIFRDWLTRHFAFSPNTGEPRLRDLIWRPGETTDILIETDHRWRPELTEFRPGVVIKRNSYNNQRVGIGDRQQPLGGSFGGNTYETFYRGSHTLFCLGGNGAQAELLGAEVAIEIMSFAPLLIRPMHLKRLQVVEIGPVAELEEATENFVVPVTVGYYFGFNWQVRKQAPTFTGFSLDLVVDC